MKKLTRRVLAFALIGSLMLGQTAYAGEYTVPENRKEEAAETVAETETTGDVLTEDEAVLETVQTTDAAETENSNEAEAEAENIFDQKETKNTESESEQQISDDPSISLYSENTENGIDFLVSGELSEGEYDIEVDDTTVYYEFVPARSGYYTICSHSDDDTVGSLYDEYGNQLNNDDDSGDNSNFSIYEYLAAGSIYYIGLGFYNGYTGMIPVEIVFVQGSDEPGYTVEATLVMGDNELSFIGDASEYYCEFIPEETDYYVFSFNTAEIQGASLYDNDGNYVCSFIKENTSFNLARKLEAGKVYYIDFECEAGCADLLFNIRMRGEAPTDAVLIKDPALLDNLLESCDANGDGYVSVGELESVTEIMAPSEGIADITGLEGAINLEFLDLSGNPLSDISALASLYSLKILYLEQTDVADITALSGLTGLSKLDLESTSVGDIAALSEMQDLVYVDLSSTAVSDVKPLLSNTELGFLGLGGTGVPLEQRFSFTGFENFDVYLGYTKRVNSAVEGVFAGDVQISVVSGTDKVQVEVSDNDNFSVTAKRTGSATIRFSYGAEYKDIQVSVKNLPSDAVSFTDSSLADAMLNYDENGDGYISRSEMEAVDELYLSHCGIIDISGLEYAKNLRYLYLGGNNIRELAPLSGLSDLTTLYLYSNNISKITALSGLSNLTKLDLEQNEITDISAVSNMKNLKELGLAGNSRLSNIQVLSQLKNLKELSLYGTAVSDADRMKYSGFQNMILILGYPAYNFSLNSDIFDSDDVENNLEIIGGDYCIDITGGDGSYWIEALETGTAKVRLSYGTAKKDVTITVKDTLPSDAVYFEDLSFVKCLLESDADANHDGYISYNDMAQLKELYVYSESSELDLTGIETAVNLESLTIGDIGGDEDNTYYYNKELIGNLSKLKYMHILRAQGFEDLSFISKLKKLESIVLKGVGDGSGNIDMLLDLPLLQYAYIDMEGVDDSQRFKLAGYKDIVLAEGDTVRLEKVAGALKHTPEVTVLQGEDIIRIEYYDPGDAVGVRVTGIRNGEARLRIAYGAEYKDITVVVAKKLDQPVLKKAVNSEKGIEVQWESVEGADRYRLYRKVQGGSWTKITDTEDTIFVDVSGTSGTTYYYTVRCITSDGKYTTSGYDKNGIGIKCLSSVTCKVSNAAGGVLVKWDKVTGAEGYAVYRKTGNGSYSRIATIKSSSTLNYTDNTAVSGTAYTYVARAYSGSTLGGYTGTAIRFLASIKPTASNGTEGITVKWSKVNGAEGYFVYRKTGNGSYSRIAEIKSGSTVSYTDKTAASGKTYTYAVRAYSGSTLGGYTGTDNKFLSALKPTVSNAANGVAVKWNKVTGAGGYYVYRKTGNGSYSRIAAIKSGSTVSYTDKTAVSGTTYTYAVRAYSGSTLGGYTGTANKYLSAIKPTVSNTTKGVAVKWNKVTGAGGYYVYRKTGSGSYSRIAAIKSGSTVSYTDKTAVKGKKYTYAVRAYSGSTLGGYTGTSN